MGAAAAFRWNQKEIKLKQIEIGRVFFWLELVCQIEETELPRTGLRYEYAGRVYVAVHLLRIFIQKLEGF